MPKRLYFTAGLMALFIAAGVYYYQLGGFKDVALARVDLPDQHLTGFHYRGLPMSADVRDYLQKVHVEMGEGRLQGQLSVCYFGNPDQEKDTIQMFIGVLQADSTAIPHGFDRIKLPAGPAVQAEINAYSVVAPNPDQINERLKAFAKEQSWVVGNTYLEKYESPEHIFSYIYLNQ